MIIQNQRQLNEFCASLAACPFIAVDTEFLRDKTYYPKLCLLQMAGPGVDAAAVDPVAFDLDWQPVWALMSNEKVLKVFHAARQDLEIFYHLTGKIPHPIFDTQVAAMVCGYGDSVSYTGLVRDLTGHVLEKSAQFTDWARRPLSKKQISYALDDVVFLEGAYEKLADRLEEQGRQSWVAQEMEVLTSPHTYENHPELAWQRIKMRNGNPQNLAVLQALAAWRESEAQRRDIPRGRVIKDDALADLASYLPKDAEGLLRVRSVPRDAAKGRTGETLLDLIEVARNSPKDGWPAPRKKQPLPKAVQPVLEMLKLLLKVNCAESGVAPKLVAGSADLEALALQGDQAQIPALQGWRYELFGKDALSLKQGRLFLGCAEGKIVRKQ